MIRKGRPNKETKMEYKVTVRMTKDEYDDFLFLSRMSHLNKSEYIKSAMIDKNAKVRDELGIRKVEEFDYFDHEMCENDDYY